MLDNAKSLFNIIMWNTKCNNKEKNKIEKYSASLDLNHATKKYGSTYVQRTSKLYITHDMKNTKTLVNMENPGGDIKNQIGSKRFKN